MLKDLNIVSPSTTVFFEQIPVKVVTEHAQILNMTQFNTRSKQNETDDF